MATSKKLEGLERVSSKLTAEISGSCALRR